MTDPRVIECAKALDEREIRVDSYRAGTVTYRVTHLQTGFMAEGENRRELIQIVQAHACILKWLKQEATTEMFAAVAGRIRTDKDAYAAMNAQAAKEISA